MNIDKERLIRTFIDLVRIDGRSLRERSVSDYIKERLTGKADEVVEDAAGEKIGGNSGNLVARVSGRSADSPLIIATHMDTVFPTAGADPVIEGGYIRSGGGTILGADDRAAIAAVLEMVDVLHGSRRDHAPLELLFTVAEEMKLLGIKAMDRGMLRGRMAFVIDSEHLPGTIVNRGPYGEVLSAEVKGRAAHAGAEPEKGVSAIQIAGRAIARMRLGRVSQGVTANIGTISGGGATNVIPDSVSIQGEARSFEEGPLMDQVAHMRERFEQEAAALGGKVDFVHSRDYDGFFIEESKQLFRLAAAAAEAAGLNVATGSSCGASDANVLNSWGIDAVTLGIGYERAHSPQERIAVSSLLGCCRWLLAIASRV